ncbi:unnamed protein product [Linum trigynum]|uniref:Secreted protein n=1 Tax=Linum trigynum TaxID=586398 RepID=A0AAV2CQT8_9ROSI
MLYCSIFAGTVAIIVISSVAQDYANCSCQFECGEFRIGYPFSGEKRPPDCGLPKFASRLQRRRVSDDRHPRHTLQDPPNRPTVSDPYRSARRRR